MTVRKATLVDLDAVLSLVRQTPSLPQWDRSALATCFDRPDSALQKGLLVADEQGTVLGFAQYSSFLPEAELEGIAVHHRYHRHGIGRELLRGVLAELQRRGVERVHLEVRGSNEAAIAFYRSEGFQQVAVRRFYYSNPVEDALILQRSL